MARELSIDLEVNPTLNSQATRNLINTLEKELRSVKTGQHLPLAKRASSVMENLMSSGVATTPTQARMILSDMMGGGFSAQQKAVLRSAQNITSAQLYFQKASRAEQQKIGVFSARAAALQNQYQTVQQQPTSEGIAGLLGGVIGIRRELLKLYQEYRVNRRQVPPILRQIAQNTSALKKDINDLQTSDEEPSRPTKTPTFLKKALSLAGITKILSFFTKSLTASTTRVFGRGLEALRLEAAYGKEAGWEGIRARAGLYNISRESAASTDIYASDFIQRMMWGEVSEREIIGLSRAGRWGRMVMSGEARKNPDLANQVFEEMLAATDPAKMRSILRQLGLPQELMNYRIPTDKSTEGIFRANAAFERETAKLLWDAANKFQAATEYWSSLEAHEAGHLFAATFPTVEAMYKLRGGTMAFPKPEYATQEIKQFAVSNPFKEGNGQITQNVNNNITINGNVDMDNVDSITEKMSAELAKSNYDAMANAIGARISF